ncbi:MAG: Co2+/Mg2+ efflux protein ApaG [Sideroxydans sp.]|nr:Co2+/Mg2+ efflux protein ApaG [Sideroxydans sp.]NOT99376.1 Co2+/Mg2+ efflux protein ApaG [Sideroxydans sp.]
MDTLNQYKVNVTVQVRYLPEQSNEVEDRHVFAYTITITNQGPHPVQLLHRHWIITDANNHVQEVKGKGVVGEQPIINPGQGFEYSSGTVLATQVGTMSGSYQMQVVDGGVFNVPIQQFVLSVPRTLH